MFGIATTSVTTHPGFVQKIRCDIVLILALATVLRPVAAMVFPDQQFLGAISYHSTSARTLP